MTLNILLKAVIAIIQVINAEAIDVKSEEEVTIHVSIGLLILTQFSDFALICLAMLILLLFLQEIFKQLIDLILIILIIQINLLFRIF